jgi:HPr kinase/phosphorylase
MLNDAALPFGGRKEIAVLLLGQSGSGKSDVALRLIAAGATLISDDQTALYVEDDRLWAAAAPGIEGLFELRGVGIVKFAHVAEAAIALAVELRPDFAPERLPESRHYQPPPPLKASRLPPLAFLNPFDTSTAAKIAAAAVCADSGQFVAGVAPEKFIAI